MKTITITWKMSWILAVLLLVVSTGLSSNATGSSIAETIRHLPFLPFAVFEAIFNPFVYWVGAALTTSKSNSPVEILFASLFALLALILIILGAIDLFRRTKPLSKSSATSPQSQEVSER
jgi:hypothetical protein